MNSGQNKKYKYLEAPEIDQNKIRQKLKGSHTGKKGIAWVGFPFVHSF